MLPEHFSSGLLSLLLVDVLHKHTLVLEHVTLGHKVECVIHVLVNLLGLSVSLEESTEHTHAVHPYNPLWHTCIGRSLPLSASSMTSLPACKLVLPAAGPGVYSNRLTDDQTILDQFTDVLTCNAYKLSVSSLVDS